MKSLNFQKLNISEADVLTRLQMKKIVGGHDHGGSYFCTALAREGYTVTSPGSCTGTLENCNTAAAEWCASEEGCASCKCA